MYRRVFYAACPPTLFRIDDLYLPTTNPTRFPISPPQRGHPVYDYFLTSSDGTQISNCVHLSNRVYNLHVNTLYRGRLIIISESYVRISFFTL